MADERDADQMTDTQRLNEVAGTLAAGLLRLLAKHAPSRGKREVLRDNPLGCPAETRPPAVNLQRKG